MSTISIRSVRATSVSSRRTMPNANSWGCTLRLPTSNSAVGSATKTSFRILPIRWSPTCPRSTKLRAAGVPSVPKNRRPPRWITTTWSKSTSKRRTTWPVFSCPGSNWPKGRSFRSCSIRRAIFSRSPVRPTTSSAAISSSRTSMSAAGTRATPFRCTCARTIFSSAGSICRISRCRAV